MNAGTGNLLEKGFYEGNPVGKDIDYYYLRFSKKKNIHIYIYNLRISVWPQKRAFEHAKKTCRSHASRNTKNSPGASVGNRSGRIVHQYPPAPKLAKRFKPTRAESSYICDYRWIMCLCICIFDVNLFNSIMHMMMYMGFQIVMQHGT